MATETSCGPPALKFGKNKALATIFLKGLNENIAGCLSSIAYLEYIWLATGGKSQLKPEKLSVLKDRQVMGDPKALDKSRRDRTGQVRDPPD